MIHAAKSANEAADDGGKKGTRPKYATEPVDIEVSLICEHNGSFRIHFIV